LFLFLFFFGFGKLWWKLRQAFSIYLFKEVKFLLLLALLLLLFSLA